MKNAGVATLVIVLAVSACQSSSPNRPPDGAATTPGTTTTAPLQVTPGPPQKPMPVVFAAGETVSRGDLSLFFLDPKTGVTEGWSASADGRCTVRGTTGDGQKLLFDCKPPTEMATPPASANAADTYALDLTSGAWTLVPHRAAPYGIVAPNGDPLTAEAAAAVDSVLASSDGFAPALEWWSPDGHAFVLTASKTIRSGEFALRTYLIRADSALPVRLVDTPSANVNPGEQIEAAWAPDGSLFAITDCCDQPATDAISVFDPSGHKMWSQAASLYHGNPRWSPDSRWLGVQAFHAAPSQSEPNPAWDLSVFDGATGAPVFRVRGAIACEGRYWTADGRLVVGRYGPGEVVVDARSRALFDLSRYVTPSPTDPNLGISFDGSDFYAVNLSDDSARLIAHTTVSPAWDFLHEPLFAGSRIVFGPHHGGHGGCGEGPSPSVMPKLELEFPPFPGE